MFWSLADGLGQRVALRFRLEQLTGRYLTPNSPCRPLARQSLEGSSASIMYQDYCGEDFDTATRYGA